MYLITFQTEHGIDFDVVKNKQEATTIKNVILIEELTEAKAGGFKI